MDEDYPIIRTREWVDKADIIKDLPENVTAEYGTCGELRFLDPWRVTMYDSEGNVVLCKCGKPAGAGMIGKEASVAWCSDCSPLSKESAQFVYRKPKND